MRAGLVATVGISVVLMTLATLGSVSLYADRDPASQGKDVKRKVVTLVPVKPIPTPPACGRGEPGQQPPAQNYVFNFKTPEHYRYEVSRQKLVSGTSFPANGQTITITAVPDRGYSFGKATASWVYTLTRARCGG